MAIQGPQGFQGTQGRQGTTGAVYPRRTVGAR